MAATETDATAKLNYDPVALADSFASAADKSAKLLGDYLSRQGSGGHSMVGDEFGLTKAFLELTAKMLSNPYRLAETQMNLWWDYSSLLQASMLKIMGQSPGPVVEPAKSDKRFRHEDWQEHFLFDFVKQSYLITARWLHNAVAHVEGLDEHTQKKVDFFTRQYIDALAPSNFALTNPEVFRETIATGGQNLVKGLNNLLDDIERGNGRLRISMTRSSSAGSLTVPASWRRRSAGLPCCASITRTFHSPASAGPSSRFNLPEMSPRLSQSGGHSCSRSRRRSWPRSAISEPSISRLRHLPQVTRKPASSPDASAPTSMFFAPPKAQSPPPGPILTSKHSSRA